MAAGGDQLSLFDAIGDDSGSDPEPDLPDVEEYGIYDKLDYKKEVTGLYISGHPFDSCEAQVRKYANCSIAELPLWRGKTAPKVGKLI